MDTRMIECPYCGGEGGAGTLTGYDHRNGEPLGYWTTCPACEGKREIEIEVEPITMDDLPPARGGGPTVDGPDRPYCKPDQSCCDFCCGN